jgi:membrane protein implicated in regulation of membrane protease activity
MLQGALREIDAVTAGEALPRGAAVRVVEVGGNGVLLVEKA